MLFKKVMAYMSSKGDLIKEREELLKEERRIILNKYTASDYCPYSYKYSTRFDCDSFLTHYDAIQADFKKLDEKFAALDA